jgi:hypothetical protein
MEGLAGASSAIAVVTVAVQLADGIRKLLEFWESIKDAPTDIQAFSKDLKIVLEVVEDLRDQNHYPRPHCRSVAANSAALELCLDSLKILQGLIDKLDLGLSSDKPLNRKWAAIKSAWKNNNIAKFRERLRDMKLTLLVARQSLDKCVKYLTICDIVLTAIAGLSWGTSRVKVGARKSLSPWLRPWVHISIQPLRSHHLL